jgi:molybdopterin-guanine dinucleotide biosynthesis protein A
VTVGSKTLFQRVLHSIEFLESEIIVVTSGKEKVPPPDGCPAYRVIHDIYPEMGPLAAIFSGLDASRTDYNLVLAGDMPFLNRDLLRYMVRASDGFDMVVPRWDNYVEPLMAVYAGSCREPIRGMIEAGDLSVFRLIDKVRVRYLDEREIDRYDPGHLSFININTRVDLEKARELAVNWDKEYYQPVP